MKIGECKGIITLRDVRVAIVRFGHDSLKKKVEDVMTKKLITIDSGSTIADAERIMAKKAIHHFPWSMREARSRASSPLATCVIPSGRS